MVEEAGREPAPVDQAGLGRGSAGTDRSERLVPPGGGRRRQPAALPRTRQLLVRFSPDEWLLVVAAAGRDGLAVGAWVGELACRVASGETGGLRVSWTDLVRELVRTRADLLALAAMLAALDRPEAATGVGQAEAEADTAGTDAVGLLTGVEGLVRRLDELLDAVIAAGPL